MLAALYAVALSALLVYGLHLLWLGTVYLRRVAAGRAGDVPAAPLPDDPSEWPFVTVQLPLYNEPAVAERLIDACAALRYPADRLEIQVLDDSTDGTPALVARRVRALRARGVDVVHLRRMRRTGYKAGALAHGLAAARGAFVAVFDADFVPPPDFLLRTVPVLLADARAGLVQARWAHLNDGTLLTRLQALGLDVHFAVEQGARHAGGLFMSFNGTAGLWRRACIDDAGGWRSATLTEDLDLSYRAQLRGWRFRYLGRLGVPAELPATASGLRTQQFRWAKGAIETARLLLGPLWRSDAGLRVKAAGTLHLTAHLAFPFLLLAALVHAPLFLFDPPGGAYLTAASAGLLGFAGFALVHVLAQRALYPDWRRRLLGFPLFLAGSVGLSVLATRAVGEALLGRRSAFVRTPKHGDGPPTRPPTRRRLSVVEVLEGALAVYAAAGFAVLAAAGAWHALPFQGLVALGAALMVAATVTERRAARRSSRPAPPDAADAGADAAEAGAPHDADTDGGATAAGGDGLARPAVMRTLTGR